jgi:hypothetical protein
MYDFCMNDHIFYQLINPWIPTGDLPVTLNRRSSEKLGIKRLIRNDKIYLLHLDIYIHIGYPCIRYCICKYFTLNDKQRSVLERWN